MCHVIIHGLLKAITSHSNLGTSPSLSTSHTGQEDDPKRPVDWHESQSKEARATGATFFLKKAPFIDNALLIIRKGGLGGTTLNKLKETNN